MFILVGPCSLFLPNSYQHIRHPLLVGLLAAFETSDAHHTVLVLEHVAGGELFDLVERAHASFTGLFIHRALAELCTALGWMHALGLVHRDMKLESVHISLFVGLRMILINFIQTFCLPVHSLWTGLLSFRH